MKIFIWIGRHKGGYEQRTLAFARFLKSNYNITPTLGFFEHNPDCSDFPQEIFPLVLKTPKLTGFDNLLLSYRLRKKFLDQFDVVYGYIASKTKAKKITRVAGDNDKTYLPKLSSRILYRILSFFDKRIERSCDGIVSCSPDAMDYLKRLGIKNICDSRNFVNTEFFYQKERPAHKGFNILYVGSADVRKNLQSLKEACSGIAGVNLHVVGVDGWIDQKKLVDDYNDADLVCMPSFYESFGNVVQEALACGVPVLVGKGVTAGRVLKDYVTVCEPTSKDIKDKIIFIRKNYEKILNNAKDGMVFVRENLSKDKILKKECEFAINHGISTYK